MKTLVLQHLWCSQQNSDNNLFAVTIPDYNKKSVGGDRTIMLKIAWVHLKLHGINFSNLYGSDCLGLVKERHDDLISNHMDESAIWEKIALTTVQKVLCFTSCNFPVSMQFFP